VIQLDVGVAPCFVAESLRIVISAFNLAPLAISTPCGKARFYASPAVASNRCYPQLLSLEQVGTRPSIDNRALCSLFVLIINDRQTQVEWVDSGMSRQKWRSLK
jgi:hypothetical protein